MAGHDRSVISHEHRVIGIHIPRTGMSSMEEVLCGENWWQVDAKSKHIRARHAKELYADYWDDYLKVSIVRNPFDRIASMLKFRDTVPHDGTWLGFVTRIVTVSTAQLCRVARR